MTRADAVAAYYDSTPDSDSDSSRSTSDRPAHGAPFVTLSGDESGSTDQLSRDAAYDTVTRYLRHLTSFLIILFIAVLAIIRFSLITEQRDHELSDLQTMMLAHAQALAEHASVLQSSGVEQPLQALEVFATRTMGGLAGHEEVAVQTVIVSPSDQMTLQSQATAEIPSAQPVLLEVHAQADEGNGPTDVSITADVASIVAIWRDALVMEMTLLAGIGIVVFILGYSFLWQSDRTADANLRSFNTSLRLEAALNKGRTGLWDWDLDRGTIDWSNSMYTMLGYQPAGTVLSTEHLDAILHPSNADLALKARALRIARKGHMEATLRLMHADGQWRWIHLHAEVIKLPGAKYRLIGAANDITERRRSERKTTEANRNLRESIEAVSDAFALWDPKGNLVASNAGFSTFNALSRSGDLTGNDGNRLCPFDLELCAAHLLGQEINADGLPLEQPIIYGLPGDRWFQVTVRNTYDGGFAFLGSDITALKENEQALVDSEARLIGAIGDLTRSRRAMAELADRYNEEKKRAEAASRAKSEFLANMSHELRTPLNAIIGFSEVMRNEMLGPLGNKAYSGYADDIHTSGRFLLAVIADVLDMAKLDTNRITIQPQREDITEAVHDCIRMVQLDAEKAEVDISTDFKGDPFIDVDPNAIRQVMLNLLNNSVKFTPKAGQITVRARRKGETLFLSVRDTGIGIPSNKIAKVTEPFEQVHSAMTRPRDGSGLGLAISRKLVDLHGGSLRIKSKQHVGTLVGLALPVSQPVGAPAGSDAHDATSAPQGSPALLRRPARSARAQSNMTRSAQRAAGQSSGSQDAMLTG